MERRESYITDVDNLDAATEMVKTYVPEAAGLPFIVALKTAMERDLVAADALLEDCIQTAEL